MVKFSRDRFAGMNQHYRRFSFREFLDSMSDCGILSVELWCGAPHFLLDEEQRPECASCKRMAEERGLKYVSLTAPGMQWQYQLASPDPDAREASVKYFCNGVHVASDLGCSVMAVNSGWGYLNEDSSDAFQRAADSLQKVADVAQQEGVTLALESLQPLESNLVTALEATQRLLAIVGHPSLKAMIDTVAVAVAGETPSQWFEAFGADIVHCHLVDGSPSGHLAWGDGEASLEETLRPFLQHSYAGVFTMELGSRYLNDPFTSTRRSMGMLERYIRG